MAAVLRLDPAMLPAGALPVGHQPAGASPARQIRFKQVTFAYPSGAIAREKEIKGWRRSKKINLIESMNSHWYDLAEHWQDTYKPQVVA